MPPEDPSVSRPPRVAVAGDGPGAGAGEDDGAAGFELPQPTLTARISIAVHESSIRAGFIMVATLMVRGEQVRCHVTDRRCALASCCRSTDSKKRKRRRILLPV